MLVLTLIALTAGIAAGFLMRGRLSGLGNVRFKSVWVLYLSLAVGVLLPLFADLPQALARAFIAVSYLGVLAFLVLNLLGIPRLRAGLGIVALGWLLNFAPIAVNGGMPLSTWAHAEAGRTDLPTPGEDDFFKIVIADETTPLRPLGDVIPIRPLRLVVSLGDLVMMAGMAVTIAQGMRAARASER